MVYRDTKESVRSTWENPEAWTTKGEGLQGRRSEVRSETSNRRRVTPERDRGRLYSLEDFTYFLFYS